MTRFTTVNVLVSGILLHVQAAQFDTCSLVVLGTGLYGMLSFELVELQLGEVSNRPVAKVPDILLLLYLGGQHLVHTLRVSSLVECM